MAGVAGDPVRASSTAVRSSISVVTPAKADVVHESPQRSEDEDLIMPASFPRERRSTRSRSSTWSDSPKPKRMRNRERQAPVPQTAGFNPVRMAFRTVYWVLSITPILQVVWTFALVIVVYLFVVLAPWKTWSLTALRFATRPLHPSSIVSTMSIPFATVTNFYCSYIGWRCKPEGPEVESMIRASKALKDDAQRAIDVFDSVLSLRDSYGVGDSLPHVSLWTLGVAIKHSSEFENRDYLGGALVELGDATREVKDQVSRLNSEAINRFIWIAHQFDRVEKFLKEKEGSDMTSDDLEKLKRLLDNLHEKIATDFDHLVVSTDGAITHANHASSLSGRISEGLISEQFQITKDTELTPMWRRLVESQTFKGKQLKRDLELGRKCLEQVDGIRYGLERTRSALVDYSSNIGHFRAGMVGLYLADNEMTAEEEVDSLRAVMAEFRSVVDQAKPASKRRTPTLHRPKLDRPSS